MCIHFYTSYGVATSCFVLLYLAYIGSGPFIGGSVEHFRELNLKLTYLSIYNSVVLVPQNYFSLVIVLVVHFEIILVSIVSPVHNNCKVQRVLVLEPKIVINLVYF